jgi:hypothetical protein
MIMSETLIRRGLRPIDAPSSTIYASSSDSSVGTIYSFSGDSSVGTVHLSLGDSSGVTYPSSGDSSVGVLYWSSSISVASSTYASMSVLVSPVTTTAVFMTEIKHGERVFELRDALVAIEEHDGPAVTLSVAALGIYIVARQEGEARAALHEEFAAIWDHLAEEPDRALTGDAIALKRAIRAMVARVRGGSPTHRQHRAVREEEHAHP